MGANTSRAEGETSLSWSYKGPGNPLSKRRTHSYSTKASRVRPAPLDESQAQQVQRKPLHESWGGIGRTLQQVTRTTADTSASTEERRSSLNAAETVATPEQWLCKLLRRSRTLKTLSEAEAERFTKPGDEDGFTRQERIYSLVAKLGRVKTPMYVVPFENFKKMDGIPRSSDRATVLARPDKKIVFCSHRWWRPNLDSRQAHPDEPFARKHQILVAGVLQLLRKTGWAEADVCLWIDYSCIDQDNVTRKLRGIDSLIGYVSRCDAMIIPAYESEFKGRFVTDIPLYGARAWCRLEAFIFWTISTLVDADDAKLYVACSNKPLRTVVPSLLPSSLPGNGALSCEADRASIQKLEDSVLSLRGQIVIARTDFNIISTDNGGRGAALNLTAKQLRDEHVNRVGKLISTVPENGLVCVDLSLNDFGPPICSVLSLVLPIAAPKLLHLDLSENRIGTNGARWLAKSFKVLPELKTLHLESCDIACEGAHHLVDALSLHQKLSYLYLQNNKIAQEGAQMLAKLLTKPHAPPCLTALQLARNRIAAPDAKSIVEAVLEGGEDCPLQTLNLAGNLLTPSAVADLKCCWPKNRDRLYI